MENKNFTYRWWILAAMGLMQTMLSFDFTSMNIAIAPIAKDLNADISAMQWVVNGFLIASAIFIIAAGRFAEILGSKKIFLFGTVLFIAASVLVALAINKPMLISGRFLQGIAASITAPLSASIVFESFPAKQKNIAIGLLVAIIGISMCLGPTVSGLLIQFLNWRWIFFINIPIGVVSGLLCLLFYYDSNKSSKRTFPNVFSIALLALFLSTFIWTLNTISSVTANRSVFLYLIPISLISLILFIVVEKKHPNSLLDYSVFKIRNFLMICVLRGFFVSFGYMAIILLFGLYLQNILGYSAINAGLIILFMTVAYALVSALSGFLVNQVGKKNTISYGMLLSFCGFLLFTILPCWSKSWVAFSIPLFIVGCSLGLLLPVCSTIAMSSVPKEKVASSYTIFYTCSFVGMAANIAFVGILIQKLCSHILYSSLVPTGITMTTTQMLTINKIVTGAASIGSINADFSQIIAATIMPLTRTAFTSGFGIIMLLSTGIALFGLIISMLLLTKDETQNLEASAHE